MVNVQFDSIEDYNCRYTLGDYRAMVERGVSPEEAIRTVGPRSRDNARTPYQWDASPNGGFTAGKPWIKVNPSYKEINLEADRNSSDSIFDYYRKLIAMRKTHPAILDGDLRFYLEDSDQLLVYTRSCARQTLLVIANKSDLAAAFALPEKLAGHTWKPELMNYLGDAPVVDAPMKPWECRIYSLYC